MEAQGLGNLTDIAATASGRMRHSRYSDETTMIVLGGATSRKFAQRLMPKGVSLL